MNKFAKKSKMSEINTYIQQIKFDGNTYSKGSVVDIKETFNIVCQDFPFMKNPKSKELPKRDWSDEDGLDVYVPDTLPMKHYDIDVVFLYVGTENNIRNDISNFIDFIYGRIKGNNGDSVKSALLAVYNEYVGMGRKDIVVSEVENEIFYISDNDPDAVGIFKVRFTVYDPTTIVSPVKDSSGKVTELSF
jgi:hypothetical protein